MSVDIGSRILFFIIFWLIVIFYWLDWENPNSYSRFLAFFFFLIGLYGAISKRKIQIQLTGHVRKGNLIEEPFYEMYDYVKKIDKNVLSILSIILLIVWFWHYIKITYTFRDVFFLGERDFTAIGESVLNWIRGYGFYSPFYGEGNASYLNHHFSPTIGLYAPFFLIFPDRISLAWAHNFFTFASLLIWIYMFFPILKETTGVDFNLKNQKKWFIIWIVFIFLNLYLYRMLLSYHYEILFVFFFTALLAIRNLTSLSLPIKIGMEIFLLLCIAGTKDESLFYLFIYYLGEGFYWFLKQFKINNPSTRKFYLYSAIWCWELALFSIIGFFWLLPQLRLSLGIQSQENWTSLWAGWMNGSHYSLEEPFLAFVSLVEGIFSQYSNVISTIYLKLGIGWEIVLGFGMLPLLAPRYYFYILSLFCIHFLSAREWHNEFYNYYIYTILPVMFYASLQGLIVVWKITKERQGLALGYLVLALVCYRNSWDKEFPYSKEIIYKNAPYSKEYYNQSVPIAKEFGKKFKAGSIIRAQFDLGIWLPTNVRYFPLTENPSLPKIPGIVSQELPDAIFTNSKNGFSPYIPLETIQEWEKTWLLRGWKIVEKKEGFQIFQPIKQFHTSND